MLLLLRMLELARSSEWAPPSDGGGMVMTNCSPATTWLSPATPRGRIPWKNYSHFCAVPAPEYPVFRGLNAYALPAMLIGSGVLISAPLSLSPANPRWREDIRARAHRWENVDDITQYIPLLTTCALQLFYGHGRSSGPEFVEASLAGGAVLALMVNVTKLTVSSLRPDGSAYNSFPSGHTATAFFGAEMQRYEYGERFPWLTSQGYILAIITGLLRIYHDRHWIADVVAGAGVGIASVWIGHALQPYIQAGLSELFPGYARLHGRSKTKARLCLAAPNYGMGLGVGLAL